ncbi:hypothetical protein KUTeg_023486 [Tegillarca granosa]|uniref:F5/8 type C domain-containing protein n=1 Tax=Tegillarca granosa TaxID=220873 RepID=A0ABQ9E6Q1_TEGGR|nr:hypothetical protein KUTeg_023486 [Tegillarca granosa]
MNKVCVTNGPLGMITGQIQDWQISASSTYPTEWDKKCNEKYARVYLPNKFGWCAKYKSSSEWLKIDLGVAARFISQLPVNSQAIVRCS